VSTSGKVLADSRENSATMENHSDRPEIIDAINTGYGHSIRYSHTLQTDMMYAAVPVYTPDKKIKFVLRTALPLNKIDRPFSNIYTTIAASGVVILLLAFVIS